MLPVVVCQFLLQLRYPPQFVEEPLVYGRQLVDVIHTHAAVKGLKRRHGTNVNVAETFISGRAQITVSLGSSRLSHQMIIKDGANN